VENPALAKDASSGVKGALALISQWRGR
jgi:hypothetical protein